MAYLDFVNRTASQIPKAMKRLLQTLPAVVLLSAITLVSSAQEQAADSLENQTPSNPSWLIGVGYSGTANMQIEPWEGYPLGFYADFSKRIFRGNSVFATASLSYYVKQEDPYTTDFIGFLVGLRLLRPVSASSSNLYLSTQLGIERLGSRYESSFDDESDSETHRGFAWQIKGGINVPLADRVHLDISAGLRTSLIVIDIGDEFYDDSYIVTVPKFLWSAGLSFPLE